MVEKGWLVDAFGNAATGISSQMLTDLPQKLKDETGVDIPVSEEYRGTALESSIRAGSGIGGIIGAPLGFLPFMATLYQAGWGKTLEYAASDAYSTARLPAEAVAKLWFRQYGNGEDREELLNDLRDQGLDNRRWLALYESYRSLLRLDEIRQLYLRGYFGKDKDRDDEAVKQVKALGYNSADSMYLVALFWQVPPLTDMVRFADYSAFDENVISKWREQYEAPEWIKNPMEQVGITGEWANKYWFSHWLQPGRYELEQMYHRGIIDKDTMDLTYRTMGYSAYWRPKLAEKSYDVITRVDLRRLWKIGSIDESALVRGYQDLGYSPDNANLLAEWTKKYYPQEEKTIQDEYKELTRAQIMRAFEYGIIEYNETLEYLQEIAYDKDTAEFIIRLADWKLEMDKTEEEIRLLSEQYDNNIISKTDYTNQLGELNLPGSLLEYLLAKHDRIKYSRTKRPSTADFRRWYKLGFITEPLLREEMAVDGYADQYIDLYIQQYNAEIGE